ncbi:hypothetical protein L4Y36_006637, partial [Pseudomonas aeruginosa]|nr:hypothetical protein [Pseudomonas aeruginosa]EIU4718838.1 hypothetical protein [Pseudomonas aeruginosa]EIU4776818.1 hypothetical protein [Pseudomonas aeruginosa]EKX5697213.1 hypothetical protein [Pseudomonas aeruginosa]EKX5715345.1 hypothetical protein [Pseudomonas aeruginosa]
MQAGKTMIVLCVLPALTLLSACKTDPKGRCDFYQSCDDGEPDDWFFGGSIWGNESGNGSSGSSSDSAPAKKSGQSGWGGMSDGGD